MVLVSAYTVVAAVVLWAFDGLPSLVRMPLALPLILFAPGYVVVTALFPGTVSAAPISDQARAELSPLERGVLAVVTSIAVVPMVTLVTTVLAGVDFGQILLTLALVTVVAAIVAVVRSPKEGGISLFHVGGEASAKRRKGVTWDAVPTDGLTVTAIAVTALLLVSSAALALTGSPSDPLDTEFYVVEGDGTAISDARNGGGDGPSGVYNLQVAQHSNDTESYTVVAVWEPSSASNGHSMRELNRFSIKVQPDATTSRRYELTSVELRSDATLHFFLFTGDAPKNPGPESAHRRLQVSINVSG